MTNRERVLAILKKEQPDCLPWFGDLAYWVQYLLEDRVLPERYLENSASKDAEMNEGLATSFEGEGLQKLHRDLGVGFYLQGYFPFKTIYEGVQIRRKEEGDCQITIYETPHGDLKEVWQYSAETYSWAPKEHLLKSYKDLDAFKYIYEHLRYEPDYENAVERQKYVGDNGLVLCYLPKSPFMELIALKAGVEVVTYMQLDAPKLFDDVLRLMEEKHDEAARIALNAPAECLMIPENISSEVVGKTNYEKYMRAYHEKWTKEIRKADKFSFVHLDGAMKGLIRELSSAGFDVLEALTPDPVGDIPIEELHKWVQGDTILWGGIPGGFFSDELSDEKFDAYVTRVINVMKQSPRYVLGVADQVVPKSRFNRIKRVSELVEQHGYYDTNS